MPKPHDARLCDPTQRRAARESATRVTLAVVPSRLSSPQNPSRESSAGPSPRGGRCRRLGVPQRPHIVTPFRERPPEELFGRLISALCALSMAAVPLGAAPSPGGRLHPQLEVCGRPSRVGLGSAWVTPSEARRTGPRRSAWEDCAGGAKETHRGGGAAGRHREDGGASPEGSRLGAARELSRQLSA